MRGVIMRAGRLVPIQPVADEIAVRLVSGNEAATLFALRRLGVSAWPGGTGLLPGGFRLLSISRGRRRSGRVGRCLKRLLRQPGVAAARPVYRVDGMRAIPRGQLLVGVAEGADAKAVANQLNLKYVAHMAGGFVGSLPHGANMFAAARRARRNQLVCDAEPLFTQLRPLAPLDPGAAGCPRPAGTDHDYAFALIEASAARALQVGDPGIVIAIIDDGVDGRHPDLQAAMVQGVDAFALDPSVNPAELPPYPQPWDGHGTACAGLAAGRGDIAGVAYGCRLMPVRVVYFLDNSDRLDSLVYDPVTVERGLRWAVDHGADVISMSLGGGTGEAAIKRAVDDARSRGRSGRGCVVVAAAGNNGGSVLYPARFDGVLAVAATGPDDRQVIKACSGKNDQWTSNYGPEINAAAPGLWLRTTDNLGAGGDAVGNYIESFSGTSAATPLVAGACALVLSRNPQLHEHEVRRIIMNSADKAGGYLYPDGRNDALGHGRLNVRKAISITPQPQ